MISPEKSRELRIGVVMYGGVSLAIYINGVSQELFRAVQGAGVYKLLKVCFDVDIIVDIISGTSAGGINGLMLGYALANGSDFTLTKDLWRESGDIAKLMHEADIDPSTATSLLDSDNFYREQLAGAFKGLDQTRFAEPGCEPSQMNEMDVYLTGTAFQPKSSTTFDDAGRPIDMQDFRQVFRLKYRPERANPGPFRPADADKAARYQAMAKLSRITSCFPGAFLPVGVFTEKYRQEQRLNPNPAAVFQYEAEVDKLLCSWGKLNNPVYFLDGGLLANKPFTPTIDAIFTRTADRPVSRVLFYVEPDPETSAKPRVLKDPDFVSAVRDGVLSIATYQSITDDAQQLEQHNSQVVRHVEVCGELRGKLKDLATGVGVPASLEEPQCGVYLGARNNQLVTAMLRGALRDDATGEAPQMTSASSRAQVKRLFQGVNQKRSATDLSFNETFERYDLFFRQRRLHHTAKWLFTEISGGTKWSEDERAAGRWLLAGLNRNVQLMEVVGYWYDAALARVPFPIAKFDPKEDLLRDRTGSVEPEFNLLLRSVSNSLRAMLAIPSTGASWLPQAAADDAQWLNARELDQVNAELQRRSLVAIDLLAAVPHGAWSGLLQWTDGLEAKLLEARGGSSALAALAIAEYRYYASLDAVIFPLDYLSNLQSFDEVRLLRISPLPTLNEDGAGCIGFSPTLGPDQKLAGLTLGHFSAFLKRSWRSNDILWGRLDAIRHIVLALVTPDRIKELRDLPALRAEIWVRVEKVGLQALLLEVFPQSPQTARETVGEFLSDMLTATSFTLTPGALLEWQDLLTQMGQLEALAEEIPAVLKDAAIQQNDWNRYSTVSQGRAPADRGASFISPAGYIDPAIVGLKIENEIHLFKESWAGPARSPRETRLGRYFEAEYGVPTEGLEHGIPQLVLAEYVMRALLILNACVLGSLPKGVQDRITGMGLYRFGLRFPLRVGHRMVRLWRVSPSMTVLSLSALLTACIAALVLGIYLVIWTPSGGTKAIIFLVLGVVLLGTMLLFLKRRKLGL